MEKHKIIKVEWIDAQTQTNRLSLEEITQNNNALKYRFI